MAFCQWLSRLEPGTYHLPSEAEWEYACRAGTTTAYYTGNSLSSSQANFGMEVGHPEVGHPTDVGSYAPNARGLCDMHGNVWEWCQDKPYDSYSGTPSDGSAWELGPSNSRVLRGGSWDHYDRYCRSAVRDRYYLRGRAFDVGFRVSWTP